MHSYSESSTLPDKTHLSDNFSVWLKRGHYLLDAPRVVYGCTYVNVSAISWIVLIAWQY